jgi:hypothetical protein
VPTEAAAKDWFPLPRPLALAVLAFITFFVFLLSIRGDFLYWDDNIYVFQEPLIQDRSLTAPLQFFQINHHGNYLPVTLTSFWLEHRVFGLFPAPYRLTNILLHIANVVLVCWLLHALTGRFAIAWVTALLFAVHPLRVEAVCWISARKELLCGLFYLLALLSHVYTVRQRRPARLLLTFAAFACALLSKGTAVTLPVALLLIDFQQRRPVSLLLFIEKIPFFVLSLVIGLVTVRLQHEVGAVDPGLPAISPLERLGVACYGLTFYLAKTILPAGHAALYLYPVTDEFQLPHWFRLLPALVIPALALVGWLIRRDRTVVFGLLFFLAAIGPVLQLLPVGAAIAADRYTYIPSIGLLLALVVLLGRLDARAKFPWPHAVVVLACLSILPYLTVRRLLVWEDTVTLMTDQIRQHPTSAFAWNDRGVSLMADGRFEEAISDYRRALRLRPDDPDATINLKRALDHLRETSAKQPKLTP